MGRPNHWVRGWAGVEARGAFRADRGAQEKVLPAGWSPQRLRVQLRRCRKTSVGSSGRLTLARLTVHRPPRGSSWNPPSSVVNTTRPRLAAPMPSTYSLESSTSAVSAGPRAGGPVLSTMAVQLSPSSVVTSRPSAVATTVVSPSVTIPSGATYCHSGPSSSKVQLRQLWPPSVETPQPLPTVPYHTCPPGPNPNAWTKSHAMDPGAVSETMCCHSAAPAGRW